MVEDLLVRLGAAVLLVDLVVPDVGHLQELADLVLGLGERVGALHLHRPRRPATATARGRSSRARPWPRSRRVDLEQLAPSVGRFELLAENFAVRLAQLAEGAFELVGFEHARRPVDDRVQRGDQLVRILAGAPDGGDGAQGVDVRVVEIEHAIVVRQRLFVAPQLLEEDARAPIQDLDPEIVGIGDVELAFEHVAELGPLSGRLVEIGQSAERFRILAAEVEHALPGFDGPRRVVQSIGRQVRDLGANLRLLYVAGRVLELALVDGVELLPRLLLLVDPRERENGSLVGLVEPVEDLTVGANGVVDLSRAFLRRFRRGARRARPARAARSSP